MSSPRLICKSAYITDTTHFFNILDYAGNKIQAQTILYKDGSSLGVDAETAIALSDSQLADVSGIRLEFKEGDGKTISYESYRKLVTTSKQSVTVSNLEAVQDDALLINANGKAYHRMEDLDFFAYLSYIEGRPGVEKADGHGLFGPVTQMVTYYIAG